LTGKVFDVYRFKSIMVKLSILRRRILKIWLHKCFFNSTKTRTSTFDLYSLYFYFIDKSLGKKEVLLSHLSSFILVILIACPPA
jgi:hypothetical protein